MYGSGFFLVRVPQRFPSRFFAGVMVLYGACGGFGSVVVVLKVHFGSCTKTL